MSDEQTQTKPENQVTDDQLNALREQIKQRDEEIKARNEELARERESKRELGNKLGNEVSQRFSAQESAIENAIVAATAEIDGLEKQQTALMEEGKFGEASKISRLIASAQYKLDNAQTQKSQLENYKTAETAKLERAKSDPLAVYSDPAKQWIRKNPAFLSDKKVNARVLAAHNMAVADDVEVDSQEYFKRLDEAINPTTRVEIQQTQEDDMDEPVEPPKPQVRQTQTAPKSSTAAPVSRGGSQQIGNSGSGKRIQLTADQAEAALISFPNLKPQDAYVKYADNMKALKEQGKL
jgi:hypothetical protein